MLAFLELLLPGFYLLGFAIGAVITGILIWLGLISSTAIACVVLAIAAIVAWLALRAIMGVRKGQKKIWHHDINEN